MALDSNMSLAEIAEIKKELKKRFPVGCTIKTAFNKNIVFVNTVTYSYAPCPTYHHNHGGNTNCFTDGNNNWLYLDGVYAAVIKYPEGYKKKLFKLFK